MPPPAGHIWEKHLSASGPGQGVKGVGETAVVSGRHLLAAVSITPAGTLLGSRMTPRLGVKGSSISSTIFWNYSCEGFFP